jgi:CheY-like chemotaxis protein
VDDQPARLLSYEAILRELGHELVSARSGPEALEMLLKEEFAVILLDVSMPGMDGFELAQLIHEHPRFEKTPIIFVTGLHINDLDRLKGYALGAVDYVHVPVVPEILRSKVSVLTELYLKRRELQKINLSLERTNAELLAANTLLHVEKARELEAANATLTQANESLEHEIVERRRLEETLVEADRKKDEFLAMLAHELRNPLAPILNSVQLLRMQDLDDPELIWCREVIERQAQHLTRLVEDLLDVSRISQGKLRLQRTDIALETVVASAIETTRPLIDARGHEFDVDLPSRSVRVFGDMTRLAQVVGNLINNAAKFTDTGGSIRVSLEIARCADGAEEALIRVRDSGVGISPEMLPRVFDLFTQGERPADRAQAGLGIGLALVHRLVGLHGGRVEAHSQGLGMGSEFVVALPLREAPAGAVAEIAPGRSPAAADVRRESNRVRAPNPAEAPHPVRASQHGPPRRILVVDDNEDAAMSMVLLLRQRGHEVEVALDGLAGLRAVSSFDPEIVFLDLGMPTLDGYEVARRIRGLPHGGTRTLVALTGYGQAEDRRRSREAGFDHHFVKPLESKDLDELLDRAPAAARPAREAGAGQRPPVAAAGPSGPGRRWLWILPPAAAIWAWQSGAPWSIAVALAVAVALAFAVALAARRPRRASDPRTKAGARVEAAALAHDLRNPLNALWGTSELLLETSLEPGQREYAERIRSSAEEIRRLADELAGEQDYVLPANRTLPAAPAAARPLRVLVVDDDPLNRTALLQLLAKLGHAGEPAADGREALSAVEREAFDVVLMDVHMNGIGGPETARSMRRSRGPGKCPRILGVTGTALAADRQACRAAGMDAVLVKPVELETLRAALAETPQPTTVRGPAGAAGQLLDLELLARLRSKKTGPGRPLLGKLVDLYAADVPGQIAQLRAATERGNAADLQVTAHRLKGSSSAIGAKALGALAAEIELLARGGDATAAAALVADLEQAWPGTRDALADATEPAAAG